MYILKNAITSIKRNKGRNILIGIIIIVISAASAITLAIRESATKIVTAYENKNPLTATIGMNRENLMKSLRDGNKSQEEMINAFNEIESISEDQIKEYGNSSNLKSYYYTYELSVDAKDIKEATDSLVKETTTTKTETTTTTRKTPSGNSNGGRMPPGGFGGSTSTTRRKTTTTKTEKIFNEKAQDGAFTLIGYNSYEDMKDFINGNYQITSGEVSNDFTSNTCVISEELATLNNLSVGSTITIIDPKTTSNTYTLEITGIYKENTDSSQNMSTMFTSSANNIITNTTFIKTILKKNSNLKPTITPTFILNDKDSIENFTNEVNEKGLSEYYKITTNLEDIESATESVNNVKNFAVTFLIITLIIGGVVLIVINMINIRERKYEIGVLRTIGMKKSKVSIQFMLELLIVTLFGLLIGAGIGAVTSVPIANSLMANEIETANSKYDNIEKNFGLNNRKENQTTTEEKQNTEESNKIVEEEKETKEPVNMKDYQFGIAKVNEIESIDAIVDFNVLIKLLGIGIILTLISSLASMIAIARFSPLTILKERS